MIFVSYSLSNEKTLLNLQFTRHVVGAKDAWKLFSACEGDPVWEISEIRENKEYWLSDFGLSLSLESSTFLADKNDDLILEVGLTLRCFDVLHVIRDEEAFGKLLPSIFKHFKHNFEESQSTVTLSKIAETILEEIGEKVEQEEKDEDLPF